MVLLPIYDNLTKISLQKADFLCPAAWFLVELTLTGCSNT